MAIPILILNIGWLFLQETPKFAYSKNFDWAIMALNNIAKFNGTEPIKNNELYPIKVKENEITKIYSPIDLIRYNIKIYTY